VFPAQTPGDLVEQVIFLRGLAAAMEVFRCLEGFQDALIYSNYKLASLINFTFSSLHDLTANATND